jgi:hypothetical protein
MGWFWMLRSVSGDHYPADDVFGMVKPISTIKTIFDPYDSMYET